MSLNTANRVRADLTQAQRTVRIGGVQLRLRGAVDEATHKKKRRGITALLDSA